MRATLIKTDGPWLEAAIATPHGDLIVMDEFSIDDRSAPVVGARFEVELSANLDEEESWEDFFSGTPDGHKQLVRIQGWRYRAYGQVTSINPVWVDCGCIQVPDVFHSHDTRVIGAHISFVITRLDATLIPEQDANLIHRSP